MSNNPYEQAARLDKAFRMMDVICAAVVLVRPAITADELTERLDAWGDRQWAIVEVLAGIKASSPTTRELVLELMHKRLETVALYGAAKEETELAAQLARTNQEHT